MDRKTAIAASATLAQETALDAFRLLVRVGLEGLSAGAISQRLNVSGASMSLHSKEVRIAELCAVGGSPVH